MASENHSNNEKEVTRKNIISLLKQEFDGLGSFINFLENGMKGSIIYKGKISNNFNSAEIYGYIERIFREMEKSSYFIDKELEKFKKKFSDLHYLENIAYHNNLRLRQEYIV